MLTDKVLLKYIIGFDIQDEYYVVRTRFPELWRLYRSNDENINVKRDEQDVELCFYYGLTDKVELQDIYDLIGETISINVDAENKVKLLQEKYEELKTVFSQHTLEELQSLKFVLGGATTTKGKETVKEQPKKSQLPTIGEAGKNNTLSDAVPEVKKEVETPLEGGKSPFRRPINKATTTTKKLGEQVQTTLIPIPNPQPKTKEALQEVPPTPKRGRPSMAARQQQVENSQPQTLTTVKPNSLEDAEATFDDIDAQLASMGY